MSEQNNNKKEEKLTLYDAFLAIFYLIIVVVGISLCISRGQNASPAHLFAVTISICATLVLKLLKYKGNLKEHMGDIIFVAILVVLAIFAIITTVIL